MLHGAFGSTKRSRRRCPAQRERGRGGGCDGVRRAHRRRRGAGLGIQRGGPRRRAGPLRRAATACAATDRERTRPSSANRKVSGSSASIPWRPARRAPSHAHRCGDRAFDIAALRRTPSRRGIAERMLAAMGGGSVRAGPAASRESGPRGSLRGGVVRTPRAEPGTPLGCARRSTGAQGLAPRVGRADGTRRGGDAYPHRPWAVEDHAGPAEARRGARRGARRRPAGGPGARPLGPRCPSRRRRSRPRRRGPRAGAHGARPRRPTGTAFFDVLATLAGTRGRSDPALRARRDGGGRLWGERTGLSDRRAREPTRTHSTGEHAIPEPAELFAVSRPTVCRTLARTRAEAPREIRSKEAVRRPTSRAADSEAGSSSGPCGSALGTASATANRRG